MEGSVRSGNNERGWNDPPEFLHNESTTPSSGSSTNKLTKRVSHSLTGTVQKDSADPLLAPPITSPTLSQPPLAPVKYVEQPLKTEDEVEKKEVSKEQIEEVLAAKVQFCKENNLSVRFFN